jgi:hypothetical protein
MSKLAFALLAVAALVIALVLLALGRPAPSGRAHGPLAARLALLVSAAMAFLGGGGERRAHAAPAAPVQYDLSKLETRAEWKSMRAAWLAVPQLPQAGYDAMSKVIAEKRAASEKLLHKLVEARLMSRESARVLCDVYADRIYHKLRRTAATCYDPTQLGEKIEQTREQLEKQLALLAGFAKKGALKPEVVQKVARTAKKQMEMVLRVAALWEKQRTTKNAGALRTEEQAILALFVKQGYGDAEIKDSIPIRPGVEEAMRLVQQIYR